jgi:hypothetical protein
MLCSIFEMSQYMHILAWIETDEEGNGINNTD